MQRKNSILKTNHSGIAMIMAIGIIVIIGTIMALSISLTSQTSKRTKDIYIYEQAALLSKSATEYALLKIAQDGACTHSNDLNFVEGTYYDINITLQYVYTSNAPCVATGGTLYTTVTTPEQNGSVLVDVAVSVTDTSITSEPIRYFRRTLQKL